MSKLIAEFSTMKMIEAIGNDDMHNEYMEIRQTLCDMHYGYAASIEYIIDTCDGDKAIIFIIWLMNDK